ncbi:adenylate kinase 5, like [Cheilinus undulatus]|uniref:adenylate kinase 5, like n=1 Tax=Cheilinus undulatus TaxID=241271 RepID=UPI001BD31B19|nr:adenylate kinase 5, like [Cheilinus undulatus]
MLNSREVKDYLSHHHLPQLLESLLTGLLYHHPEDPISFLHSCLIKTRQLGGPKAVNWDTFIHLEKHQPRQGPPRPTSVPPKAPFIPSVNNEIIFGPQQTAPGQYPKLLPPSPPGPTVSPPPIVTEGSKDKEKTAVTTEGPPPLTIQSQLSIDSDSDMTESSGLQQEVSIKPPQKPCPIIIFIIGGPGSGKGSQAARLAQSFNLRVISLDELLRRQLLSQASPSKKWEIISQMMSHGELGPQEETISELRRQLIGEQEVKGFIVDGFPRDVHQALSFQEQTGSPDLVMLLLCSNDTLRCRLQRRATELGLLGDSSHALRKRLDTFQREIISLRRYYKQLNLLRQVDADRDEDQVFADLSSVIREKLPQKESSDLSDILECSSAAVPSD